MSTVTFKTEEDAIFEFDRKSVSERLEQRKISYKVQELDLILDVISSQSDQTILSSAEHRYFGFIALDLISAGKGSVVCKNCGKRYRCNQLEDFATGPDEIKSKVNTAKKGGFKSLFRSKPKPFGMYGGKGYKCPEGHELIFMITWRT
jgi:hypothetical protein